MLPVLPTDAPMPPATAINILAGASRERERGHSGRTFHNKTPMKGRDLRTSIVVEKALQVDSPVHLLPLTKLGWSGGCSAMGPNRPVWFGGTSLSSSCCDSMRFVERSGSRPASSVRKLRSCWALNCEGMTQVLPPHHGKAMPTNYLSKVSLLSLYILSSSQVPS